MSEERKKRVTKSHFEGNFKALYEKDFGVVLGRTAEMTPQQFFEIAKGYFQWAEENAIKAAETATFQGDVNEWGVNKPRIFTITGLSLFCGVNQSTLGRYRHDPNYAPVMEFIDSVIYEQKFQLAAVGMINASFVGKEMGIDKGTSINVNANAEGGSSSLTTEEVKAAVKDVLDMI
ncbi:terminase small subunit [Stenotrophomonas phage vB_SmeS_BUCT705]|uniref:Terminase small subunit n=2 Tax=Webervirus TaxID=1920860 RepID=A0AAE9GBH7_9CAUD|nr:terminase small subunit [Stenotrophomonas phage vB_SmeS_BUCT705]WCF59237.1 putative terminase small subunit [Klebsiella phage vB_LZ2044]